jgi:tetratricopeptide (TPR) repeat protein
MHRKGYLSSPLTKKIPDFHEATFFGIITLTAELFRAILKPNRGRLLYKEVERKYKIDLTKDLDYCCSYIELFYEVLDADEVTSIISQMIETNPNHPRILALQARIFNRRRDYHTSLQILQSALESTNLDKWNSKEENEPSAPISSLSIWYSLFDSALELFQWDTAFYIIHQTLELAPLEPRAHLNLARLIVLRASINGYAKKSLFQQTPPEPRQLLRNPE